MEFTESIENDKSIVNYYYEEGLMSEYEYLTQMAEIKAREDFYYNCDVY